MIIAFTLPFVPLSKSNAYKSNRTGRLYKTSACHTQESAIQQIALQSLPIGFPASPNGWSVDATFYYSDKRRRDLDGHLKLLLDSLNGIVYRDDSQIFEINIRKVLGAVSPMTEVILTEL
jgi:Holliday junction resolvase RusA-like endonuclease